MDSELLKHLPRSFQLWQQIEAEAQKRAEARFQEILRKANEGTGAVTPAPIEHQTKAKGAVVDTL